MAETTERILCISTYEKGQDFLRQLAEVGVRTTLLTVDKLRSANWPREALEDLATMPENLTCQQVMNTVSWMSRGRLFHRVVALDATTGKRLWQQARFGKGNLIAADGKLFLSTMTGELVVVRANPAAYEEIGRKQVLGATRQAPALADGRMFLRDDKEIVCLDVRR